MSLIRYLILLFHVRTLHFALSFHQFMLLQLNDHDAILLLLAFFYSVDR